MHSEFQAGVTNRVTGAWNVLSEVIVTAPSLSSLKSRLKQFDFNKLLIDNKTNSYTNNYRVIWFIVSGTGYDALMPWYNQATLHYFFVFIACIYFVI